MKNFSLAIPGLTIACKSHGSPKNPPIVALHGWLDNANSFDWLAERLQEEYYLIAIDLPGHGLSSHIPLGCHYHFSDGIFTVVEIIKALGLKKPHLLGHSMGACLASLVAGVAPDLFKSVFLIEGLGPFSAPAETANAQLKDYLVHQIQPDNKAIKAYSSLDKAAHARAKRGHVSLPLAMKLCERGVLENDGEFFWRHDRRLLISSPLRMTEEQVLSCLSGIKTKSCLIWATEGFAFNSEALVVRTKSVKHLEVLQLPGGHHIHMENPELIANALIEFYKKV